jgi:hypothetical protein
MSSKVYKDQALLPFSAKVNSLDYFFDARCVRPEDFHSLDIPAKNFSVNVWSDVWEVCDQLLIAMLNRMTTLGHFTRCNLELALSPNVHYDDVLTVEVTARIADASIGFISANPSLTHLVFELDWVDMTHHLPAIFHAMEEHKELRTFRILTFNDDDYYFDDSRPRRSPIDYPGLEKLLSRNRNISVLYHGGKKITNGTTIDRIYALNRFYCGSAKLVNESSDLRPLLVASALLESGLHNAQYTALLLSNHVDILCEIIVEISFDTEGMGAEEAVSLVSIRPESTPKNVFKRKLHVHLPRDVKKTVRKEC